MGTTVCVIPALNASATLPDVLDRLRVVLPEAAIVGVDDGSTDGTISIMRAACERAIRFPINLGKGAALRTGFEAALSMGAERVVTIDADGQHDPSFAPQLVDALRRADVAVGARSRSGTGMPFHRKVTNALSSAAIQAVTRCSVPDGQSGYRAIRRPVLEAVRASGDRYEFETDFLIRAARQGFRLASVPVPTIYDGAPSHFRHVRDSLRVVATIWRHREGALS
jgi:glycosyltransferase involved in cell wall biosynthesis